MWILQLITEPQLSAEQRQRIEENRRNAKERLKKTKAGRLVSRGPDTPSQSKDDASAE